MTEPVLDRDAELRRRLADLRRTGDLDLLWPDLPGVDRRRAMAGIKAVVHSMLGGESRLPVLAAADAHEARVLGVAAFTSGMGSLLGWWIEEGRVEASPPARELLGVHLRHGRRRSALLREQASRIARGMHASGLRPILLKGLHTGGEFFPHPSTRPAADIDILVSPTDRARGGAVLADLGFTEVLRSVFGKRSEWSPSGSSPKMHSLELDHADNPWGVDLHETLGRWYFRGIRRELGWEPFDTMRFTDVCGESVRVLDQPYLTAFLALHAGYDLARVLLVRLFELVLVIRDDTERGRLDWGDLASLIERAALGRFVYPALVLAEELAPGTVEAGLLRRIARDVSPRMHRVLDAVRRAEMGPLNEVSLDVKLAWAVGGKELLMNLSDILVPSDDGAGSLMEYYARRLSMARWRISRRRVPGAQAPIVPPGGDGARGS